MDIAVTNYELAHKSNPPQYWVFIWSLPTAAYSPEKRKDFATCIYASIKKSWHDAKAFIKVQVADSSKPVLEVRGMIWTSGDKEPPFDKESPFDKAGALPHPTIEDLQNRIRRQAQRAMLEIVDKEVLTGLKLNLLSDKVAAGSWAYNSLDRTIPLSSFVGNLEFVYLITMESNLSYNDTKEVTDRMELWTGQNFGWIEYYNGRYGIPSGRLSSRW